MFRAIVCFVLLFAAFAASAADLEPRLRVLFVGNSLTYYNDLPATFATLYRATAPHTRVETEMLAQGGGKLRERLDDGVLASLLAQQHFDVVVLQELGGFPVCPTEFPGCADAPSALRESVALARAHGARVLWFSTWQAQADAQTELSARSAVLARDVGVERVDVGAAMQRLPAAARSKLLHSDGHPAPLGTWLTAATLVRAVAAQALPAQAPPCSCGSDWRGHLSAASVASKQTPGAPQCHALTPAQWRVVREAALQ